MRVISMSVIGFVAMVAVIGMGNTSATFAADASREAGIERHGVGGAIYSSSQLMVDGAQLCARGEARRTVDTIERIGHGGSTYQAKGTQTGDCQAGQRVDVVQRIGQGGSSYSSSQTMSN